MEYHVRDATRNQLVDILDSEPEAQEFLNKRTPGNYKVWEVDELTGRVYSIIKGTNFAGITLHSNEGVNEDNKIVEVHSS